MPSFRFLSVLVPAAIAACSLSAAALAQQIDCAKAATTPEVDQCAEQDFRRADKKLNDAYDKTLARIASDASDDGMRQKWRLALQDAQRKWLAFRDADCDGVIAYEWYGGTGETAASWGCKTTTTEQRTKDLLTRLQP